MAFKDATLTAENTFTDWIEPTEQTLSGVGPMGFLDLIISGTWAGTITVQKKFTLGDTDSDTFDVDDYSANQALLIEDHATNVSYRAGFKTGDFTSGSAYVRLEQ